LSKIEALEVDLSALQEQLEISKQDLDSLRTSLNTTSIQHKQEIDELLANASRQDEEISERIVKHMNDLDNEKKRALQLQDLLHQQSHQ
jgi:hypothetical protein